MRKLCDRAGVKHLGFHAMRHLAASKLYQIGHEAAVIQTTLRHKIPNTTERYLKSIGLERVRDALEVLSQDKGEVLDFRPRSTRFAVPDIPE